MLKRLITRRMFPAIVAVAALVWASTTYISHVDKQTHDAGKKHCEICLILGSTPAAPAPPAIAATPAVLVLAPAEIPQATSPSTRRFSAHRSRAPPSLS